MTKKERKISVIKCQINLQMTDCDYHTFPGEFTIDKTCSKALPLANAVFNIFGVDL